FPDVHRGRTEAAHESGNDRVPEGGGREVRGVPREPARVVPLRDGDDAARPGTRHQDALRDAAVAEGARDAPSRPADDGPADARHRAAPDDADERADGADAGRRGRSGAAVTLAIVSASPALTSSTLTARGAEG